MKLSDYLSAHGQQTDLARAIGAQPQLVWQWAKAVRPVPIERCVPIERATNGQVTRQDLRPDDWHEIWPELAQASAQPTQPATQNIASTAEPAAVKLVCREAEGVVIGPDQRTHAPRQYQDPGRDRRALQDEGV